MTTAKLAKLFDRIQRDYPQWRKNDNRDQRQSLMLQMYAVCQDIRKIAAVAGMRTPDVVKIINNARGKAGE